MQGAGDLIGHLPHDNSFAGINNFPAALATMTVAPSIVGVSAFVKVWSGHIQSSVSSELNMTFCQLGFKGWFLLIL
jgi:hypothetical protein